MAGRVHESSGIEGLIGVVVLPVGVHELAVPLVDGDVPVGDEVGIGDDGAAVLEGAERSIRHRHAECGVEVGAIDDVDVPRTSAVRRPAWCTVRSASPRTRRSA